jgi:hypothetical protein
LRRPSGQQLQSFARANATVLLDHRSELKHMTGHVVIGVGVEAQRFDHLSDRVDAST